jgi:hypothetical protein
MMRDVSFPADALRNTRLKCAGVATLVVIISACAGRNDDATTGRSTITTSRGATIADAKTARTATADASPLVALGVTVNDTTVKRDWPGCARHGTSGWLKEPNAFGKIDTTETRIRADNEIPWPWAPYDTLHNRPIDSKYKLLLARAPNAASDTIRLCVKLMELAGAGRVWDIATLPANSDFSYQALRADSSSIVLLRSGDYGMGTAIKFFLDPASKQLLKQIQFSRETGLDAFSDEAVATAFGVPADFVRSLKGRDPIPGREQPSDNALPTALIGHPMPTSTYSDFASARPERVKDGYDSTSGIGETIGPLQVDSSRIWFGKSFYDGEGESGVGGVGYFDTSNSTYTFLKIPELAPWSGSALLVKDQTVWMGLVGHPEGADYSGGLLRHDLRTGITRKIPINEVIQRIKPWNGKIYLVTGGGAWVIEGDGVVTRFLVEPDLNGEPMLIRVESARRGVSAPDGLTP